MLSVVAGPPTMEIALTGFTAKVLSDDGTLLRH